MMRALIKGDFVTGAGKRLPGPEIPMHMRTMPVGRLRVLDGEIVDAAGLSTFYIDADGRKHAVPGDGWQEIDCQWDDKLNLDAETGDWYLETDAERLATAKAAALKLFIGFADGLTAPILRKYPVAETTGWGTKQAEAAHILGGGDVADTMLIKALATEHGLDAAGTTALAQSVIDRATEFAAIAAAIESLRNQAQAAIEAVNDTDQIAPTLAALKDAATIKAAELGLA